MTVGLLSFASLSVPLANRKVQVGLNLGADTFKNLLSAMSIAAYAKPSELNTDLYPTGTLSDNYGGTVGIPGNITNTTTMVLAWTGLAGTSIFNAGGIGPTAPGGITVGTMTGISMVAYGNGTFSGTNGYAEFTFNNNLAGQSIQFLFSNAADFGSVGGGNQIKNVILCRKIDYNAIINATGPGDLFNDDFVTATSNLSPKTIRCLGFIGAVGCATQHRYRLGWNTALSFANAYPVPNTWAGGAGTMNNITSSDGANFVCAAATDTPVAYTAGEVIQGQFGNATAPVTLTSISNGTPAVFSKTAHGLPVNTSVYFTTTGTLPTGLTQFQTYYVIASGLTANAFEVSLTAGGAAINTTSAGSGTHSFNTMTINVGSRGVVPVYSLGAGPFSDAGPASVGTIVTLIYDDVLQGYLLNDTSAPGYGWHGANVPIEMQIGLANRIGCNLWYQLSPHVTVNNSTMESGSNSVAQQAALLASTLNNSCYPEFSNEIWNNGAPYIVNTGWANLCAIRMGLGTTESTTYDSFYGYKLATIMPAFKTAWGARSGLFRVAAFQMGASIGDSTDTNRLRGTLLAPSGIHTGSGNAFWSTYTGSADYTQKPNRPVDCVECLSYAPYYSGAQMQNFEFNYSNAGGTGLTTSGPAGWTTGLIGAADAYTAGGSTNIANAIAFVDWDLRQGTNNGAAGGLASEATFYSNTNALASSFTADRPSGAVALTVDCYEGAMEANYIIDLFTASNLGLTVTTTATLNTNTTPGSGLAVSWTAHGLDNGASVGFNVSITDTPNGQTTNAYNITGGGTFFYVVNTQTNSFDIAYTPGGTAIKIGSVGGGTQTAWGSNYSGGADRIGNLLRAYKQSATFQATVKYQYDQLYGYSQTATVCWFNIAGGNAVPPNQDQWSMYNGDVYSTPRYTSYDAVAAYHS